MFIFLRFLVSSRSVTTMESAVVHVRLLSIYTRAFHHGECVHTDRHSCGPTPSHTRSIRVSILIATCKPLRIGSYSLLKAKAKFIRFYVCDVIDSRIPSSIVTANGICAINPHLICRYLIAGCCRIEFILIFGT